MYSTNFEHFFYFPQLFLGSSWTLLFFNSSASFPDLFLLLSSALNKKDRGVEEKKIPGRAEEVLRKGKEMFKLVLIFTVSNNNLSLKNDENESFDSKIRLQAERVWKECLL